MKKLLVLVVTFALLLTLFTGCAKTQSTETPIEPTQREFLSLGTGSVSGVYYPLGGAFASILNNNMGQNCSVESTGGSVENALLISDGKVDFALADSSTTYSASKKLDSFVDKDTSKLRGVLSLYPEVVQIVSTNPDIKTVADLKGKKIAVGAAGSGTETIAQKVLATNGMTYDDISEDFLGFSDASSGLKDKTIDAAFIWAGVPTSGIMDIASQHNITIVNISDKEIEELKKISPFMVSTKITTDMYTNMAEEATTFAVPALMICSADLSEELVYNFLVETFKNISVLQNAHIRGNDITLETALDGMDGITLHPGAEKFYKEKGMIK